MGQSILKIIPISGGFYRFPKNNDEDELYENIENSKSITIKIDKEIVQNDTGHDPLMVDVTLEDMGTGSLIGVSLLPEEATHLAEYILSVIKVKPIN